MNDISKLLYWADVLPSLASGIAVICVLAFIGAGIGCIATIVNAGQLRERNRYFADKARWESLTADERKGEEAPSHYSYGYERDTALMTENFMFCRWLAPLLLVIALSTNFVPSRETFYMIASSEIAEQGVKTEEFAKVRKVVNNWLDAQLEEKKEDKDGE